MKRTPMVRTGGLKRSTPLRQTGQQPARVPLVRSGRVNPVSAKRVRENRTRAKVVAEIKAQQDWCTRCGVVGPLDAHELVRRSQYRGGITDPRVICLLCRTCHQWVTEHPVLAHDEGFSLWSWERPA